MKRRYLEEERRKQRRLERLGTQNPSCSIPGCNQDDWRCLDIHHVADLGFDATTVILCANCHRKVTDAQKNHPPHCDDADTQLEQIARVQFGLVELLKLTVAKLSESGEALIERARLEAA